MSCLWIFWIYLVFFYTWIDFQIIIFINLKWVGSTRYLLIRNVISNYLLLIKVITTYGYHRCSYFFLDEYFWSEQIVKNLLVHVRFVVCSPAILLYTYVIISNNITCFKFYIYVYVPKYLGRYIGCYVGIRYNFSMVLTLF